MNFRIEFNWADADEPLAFIVPVISPVIRRVIDMFDWLSEETGDGSVEITRTRKAATDSDAEVLTWAELDLCEGCADQEERVAYLRGTTPLYRGWSAQFDVRLAPEHSHPFQPRVWVAIGGGEALLPISVFEHLRAAVLAVQLPAEGKPK